MFKDAKIDGQLHAAQAQLFFDADHTPRYKPMGEGEKKKKFIKKEKLEKEQMEKELKKARRLKKKYKMLLFAQLAKEKAKEEVPLQ